MSSAATSCGRMAGLLSRLLRPDSAELFYVFAPSNPTLVCSSSTSKYRLLYSAARLGVCMGHMHGRMSKDQNGPQQIS